MVHHGHEPAIAFKPVRVGIGPIANQVADTGNAYRSLETVGVSYDPVGHIPAITSSRNAQPFRVDATQAYVDVSYGPKALELLKKGLSPTEVIKQVWESNPDPRPERWPKLGRQFAVMNAKGEYAAFTGERAPAWAGHKGGKYCTAQGNILAGEKVVKAMVEAFENTAGHLSLRLVAALEAGQAAGGGDRRGRQSAALLIVKKMAASG